MMMNRLLAIAILSLVSAGEPLGAQQSVVAGLVADSPAIRGLVLQAESVLQDR